MASKPKQTASGTWQIRRVVGGKQESRNFPTQKEAEAQWALWTADKIEGRPGVAARNGRITLAAHWKAWRAQATLAPSTLALFDSSWRCWVRSSLGTKRLADITRGDVKRALAGIYKDSGSAWTTDAARRLIVTLLREAWEDELIAANPASRVGLPKAPKRGQPQVLTPAQLVKLWDCTPKHWRAAVMVASMAGLRPQEVAGIKVTAVDFKTGRVRIEWAIPVVNGRSMPKDVKTEAGERSMPLPKFVVDALAAHVLEDPPGEQGWVFHSRTGGPLDRSTFRRMWVDACKAAGIPGFKFENLRHTNATLLEEMGVTDHQLKTWMGHTNVAFTRDRYVQSKPSDEIARKLEEMFRR